MEAFCGDKRVLLAAELGQAYDAGEWDITAKTVTKASGMVTREIRIRYLPSNRPGEGVNTVHKAIQLR